MGATKKPYHQWEKQPTNLVKDSVYQPVSTICFFFLTLVCVDTCFVMFLCMSRFGILPPIGWVQKIAAAGEVKVDWIPNVWGLNISTKADPAGSGDDVQPIE